MKKVGNNQKNGISEKVYIVLYCLLLFLYGCACVYLYYNQACFEPGGKFESDLAAHISMALDGWGYSLTAVIYRLFYMLPMPKIWIAIFLALVTVGTIPLTARVLRPYIEKNQYRAAVAIGVAFVMPFYIATIQGTRYIGYQSPSIWHNSTYIVMKLLATVTLFLCFHIAQRYSEQLEWKKCILFAALLALTTATKTSFVVVFAPMALLMLIADGFLGVSLKRLIQVALTIVPTLFVIGLQEVVLFGEDTGNGIVIDFGYTVFLRAEKPQYTMILSALFPVMIFLFNIIPVLKDTYRNFKKKEKKLEHREFLFSWGMWLFGALELLFLKETGNRIKDGNFMWGYNYCLFILFVVSCIYLYRNIKSETFLKGNKILKSIYVTFMSGILGYHVYCGIFFFLNLLEGTSYFM